MINHTSLPHWLAYLDLRSLRRGRQPRVRRRPRPRLRAARPAREDDGHARAGADPARADGLAGADRRRVRALPAAAELGPHLPALRSGRQPDADHRARASRSWSPLGITVFLRFTKLGTAMRALANDREITATLGVPVRRVEASAWLGSGLVCGAAGLLLPDLLTSLDYAALTFLVISVARRGADRPAAVALGDAARRSRRRPRAGGLRAVRVDHALPRRGAVRARDHRAALALAASRRHASRGQRAERRDEHARTERESAR